jgi:hypothetical protein
LIGFTSNLETNNESVNIHLASHPTPSEPGLSTLTIFDYKIFPFDLLSSSTTDTADKHRASKDGKVDSLVAHNEQSDALYSCFGIWEPLFRRLGDAQATG